MNLKELGLCAGLLVAGASVAGVTTLTATAHAKEASFVQAVNVYEAMVRFPPPIWVSDGDPRAQSEYFRQQNGPQFILEQIPKGQKFESWSQLYAVRGDYLKADQDIPLDSYISMSLQVYVDICGQERISFKPLSGSGASRTILLLCEASPHAPQGSGYGKKTGEVAVFHFAKVKDTFVKVYHEWRGTRFSAQKPETWPVSVDTVQQTIDRLQTIRIGPAQ